MEWYWWILIVVAIVAIMVAFNSYKKKKKRERLMQKYGDEALVNKLMQNMFWVGQSEEQLLDSLGKPLGIDQKVLKSKTKEIWKYNETGKNRYALKITIENGEVVGWDKK